MYDWVLNVPLGTLIPNLGLIALASTQISIKSRQGFCFLTFRFLAKSLTYKTYHNLGIKRNHCMKVSKFGVFSGPHFPLIRTKYVYLLCKSPYLEVMRENADQKKLQIGTLFTQWKLT